MKKFCFAYMVIFLFTSVLFAGAGPKISFSEEKWDFGSIKQGEKVTHVFEVRNAGDDVLVISKVRSSCGCTVAIISKREIKPGEKGEISATFNSAGRSGHFNKSIFVESNDPVNPVKTLTIIGNILVPKQEVPVKLIPPVWKVGFAKPDTIMKNEVSVLNTGYDDFSILAVNTSEFVSTSFNVPYVVNPGSTVKVSVELRVPGKDALRVDEKVILYTNIPDMPTVVFFIRGIIDRGQNVVDVTATDTRVGN